MSELSVAKDFYALASERFQRQNYKGAINAFRKLLAIKEDWNSYKGLGSALVRVNQFEEAIDAFTSQLALRNIGVPIKGLD